MDIISYSLASEADLKGKTALDKIAKLERYQVTKLGVSASSTTPHKTSVTINNTLDFIRPTIEVLKVVGPGAGEGGGDYIKSLAAFNNTDASDFNADSQVSFTGTMQLKTDYTKATTGAAHGAGLLHSALVSKSSYQSVEQLTGDSALTGVKYLIEEAGSYKRYNPASNAIVHDFTSGERTDFAADDQIIFNGEAKLKTSYSEAMTYDSNFTETGSLLRNTIDKSAFKAFEKVSVSK